MGLVFFGANGAAHPLRQADGRGGHHQFAERVAPAGAQPFGARFAHGVVGRGEGQFGDEQRFAQAPGQIQPFAKRLHAKDDGGVALGHALAVLAQQLRARPLVLHQHLGTQAVGQQLHGTAHLLARGEQHQRPGAHLGQVGQQGLHHVARVGLGFARVGGGFAHHELALAGVVEGAGHFQGGEVGVAVQAAFAQEKIKLSATGERGRGEHGGARTAPQVLAQRVAGQHRVGVGTQHAAIALVCQGEPFGGRHAARWGVLQQQLGAGVHGFEARRQSPGLGVELGEAARVVGFVAQLRAQGLGNGAQHFQKTARVVGRLGQGLDQLTGQLALGHARTAGLASAPARRGAGAGAGQGRRFVAAQGLGVQRQHQAGQLLQMGAQARSVLGHVGNVFHFHQLANAQRPAGELVDPRQAGDVHLAAKLCQRGAGQVVGFVEDEQAVVQLGQQACAQRRQQQIVVGHNDLRGHQLFAPLKVAALRKQRAVLVGAGVGVSRHAGPQLGLGRGGQLVAVAIPLAAGQALRQAGVELRALALRGHAAAHQALLGRFGSEQVVGHHIIVFAHATEQALELEFAHVAPAPLGQGEGKGLGHLRSQRGQVFVHQLLLQRHGGGGNQHPRAPCQRHMDGGYAVGQRFTHPRARLDDGQRPLRRTLALGHFAQLGALKSLGHQRGHLLLPGPGPKACRGLHDGVKLLQGGIGPRGRGHEQQRGNERGHRPRSALAQAGLDYAGRCREPKRHAAVCHFSPKPWLDRTPTWRTRAHRPASACFFILTRHHERIVSHHRWHPCPDHDRLERAFAGPRQALWQQQQISAPGARQPSPDRTHSPCCAGST